MKLCPYYSPSQGRFTSIDSIGVWGDAANWGNAYGYVASRPQWANDPTGQCINIFSKNCRGEFMNGLDKVVAGKVSKDELKKAVESSKEDVVKIKEAAVVCGSGLVESAVVGAMTAGAAEVALATGNLALVGTMALLEGAHMGQQLTEAINEEGLEAVKGTCGLVGSVSGIVGEIAISL